MTGGESGDEGRKGEGGGGGGVGVASLDGIVFDCDGVLVDVTESYSAAIIQTVRRVLDGMGIAGRMDHSMIDGFKSTGGFNDEIDLAYAAILGIVAARRLGRDAGEYVCEVVRNADQTGIRSVEEYLSGVGGMQDVMDRLDYPGGRTRSVVYRTFNELFYGPVLYEKAFGEESSVPGPGLIDSDRIIPDHSTMDALRARFGPKMAMVTGRGYEPARYTLGDMMGYFDVPCCRFLEDMPRVYAKPNPLSLEEAIGCMGCKSVLYVGDSVEDMLMANSVRPAVFCGIAGAGTRRRDLFAEGGAAMILDSVLDLPGMLKVI